MTTPAGSIFVQLQTSLEAAIVTAGTVYQSFGLLHRTSALDVKHEFATIVATLVCGASPLCFDCIIIISRRKYQ